MANVLMDKFILAVYSHGGREGKSASESDLLEHGFSKADLFSASESAESRGLSKPVESQNAPIEFILTLKGHRYAEALLDDTGVN